MRILVINMKRYFAIYRCLLQLNYHRALTHKEDFFNNLVGSMLWGFFSIVIVFILTSRSSSVFGWSREDLYVLTGVFNILVGGFYRTFFSRSFDLFSHVIQLGELDGFLLKPVNSQFALSCRYITYGGFVRIFFAVVYTLFALRFAHSDLTLFSVFAFVFLGIFGLILIYSLWYLVLTTTIWFPDVYNLTEFLYTADNVTRYPPQVLWSVKLAAFLVFYPLTLVVSVPTKVLLHTATLSDSILLIGFALGLLYLSRLFWNFALRSYTSASG